MPAVDLRQLIAAVVASEGVRTAADLKVTQRGAGANMSVDVAAGTCLIQDDHASGGGFYGYTLGSTANVAVGTANATNPRIDRVVVKILDNALGDASNSASVVVVAGTATAGATLSNLTGAAAVPNSSLLLANVLVPAASSSVTNGNIDTTVRQSLMAAGGQEVAYAEFSTGGTNVPTSATTFAGGATVVTAPAFVADGVSKYRVEFYVPAAWADGTGAYQINFSLSDGGTDLGIVARPNAQLASGATMGERFLTPSAGSHTYSIVAYVSATGTGHWISDVGGAGKLVPGYIRVTKSS